MRHHLISVTREAQPSAYANPQPVKESAMFDFATLEDFLLPEAQEIMELAPYEEEDYLQDVPAFRDAIQEVMTHRVQTADDAPPTVYGA
ncbi:MAG: hypothetical protein AB7G06_02460 [Bdellovibrionales bacterium]